MGLLSKVLSQTPTRFWVNNPSMSDMDKSIAAGARNVTTNPAYCSKLIKSEPEYLREVIDAVIADTADDDIAADLVYQKASKRAMDRFIGIYNESGGKEGYVTIQLDPRLDGSADTITEGAIRHSKLGPNYMAKIPVTSAGLAAIENVLRMGIPVCATEIFAISQAISACEIHKRITEETGKNVPFYVTHITGIFDEYLAKYVAVNPIDIDPQVLGQAGSAVGRKQYHLIKEKGYDVVMLGGGARGPQHFSDFFGGEMDVTLNWSLLEEMDGYPGDPVNGIDVATSEEIIRELMAKLPDFKKAYETDGLSADEFEHYGPVRLFRNNFLEGYYILLAEIAKRRAAILR